MLPVFSLLVLRARDIETTASFYLTLGLEFTSEQHGTGPVHFACERDGFVLEIYPLKPTQSEVNDSLMLGFGVESLETTLEHLNISAEIKTGETRFCNVRDPDGRTVRLEESGV